MIGHVFFALLFLFAAFLLCSEMFPSSRKFEQDSEL